MKKKLTSNSVSFLVAFVSLFVITTVLVSAYNYQKDQKEIQENEKTPQNIQQEPVQTQPQFDIKLEPTLQTTQTTNPSSSDKTEVPLPNIAKDEQPSSEHQHEKIIVTASAGSIAANERVRYKINRFKKLALQPLEFEVFDSNQKPLTPNNLKTVHEYKMHFIVVSANLKEYLHLHPTFEKGKWRTLAYLPTPGTYYAYIDITPTNGKPEVLRTELTVRQSKTLHLDYPQPTPELSLVTSGNYKGQLTLTKPNILQQTVFSYNITQTGLPAKNIQPYLGALGHVVVLKHGNPVDFTHLHPLDSSNASQGLIEFVATFSKAGRYTAFAQFKIGAKVYDFPITFEITN